jgi:outer membrane murein-binding lipoprotein Lpp
MGSGRVTIRPGLGGLVSLAINLTAICLTVLPEPQLERERVERAKAESTARTLRAEVTELRVESRQTLETVTAWVEQATRAEARLGELAKGAEGPGHRS